MQITEQDDVLAQLEERLELLVQMVTRLKGRVTDLEKSLQKSEAAREEAQQMLAAAEARVSAMNEELGGVRTKNKEAAGRIKNLLTQMEQMDLLT